MNRSFKASGVISITTDFGHRGPFVGTMKGVIYTRFPGARIVDLTHEAYVHWPAEAGFWIARAYQYFPVGTVHVAVVDPGVGTDRSALLAQTNGHVFLAPDNGLLAELIESTGAEVWRVRQETIERYRLPDVSATFHGRDIFAPLVAALASGELNCADAGESTRDFVPSIVEPAELQNGGWAGMVITTDHFGNLITNIPASALEPGLAATIMAAGKSIPVRRTYGDVEPGTLLALVNSFGVIEIARAEQNAAEHLGIGRGSPVRLTSS